MTIRAAIEDCACLFWGFPSLFLTPLDAVRGWHLAIGTLIANGQSTEWRRLSFSSAPPQVACICIVMADYLTIRMYCSRRCCGHSARATTKSTFRAAREYMANFTWFRPSSIRLLVAPIDASRRKVFALGTTIAIPLSAQGCRLTRDSVKPSMAQSRSSLFTLCFAFPFIWIALVVAFALADVEAFTIAIWTSIARRTIFATIATTTSLAYQAMLWLGRRCGCGG